MTDITELVPAMKAAAEKYRLTLEAHRNNPRDYDSAAAWDEATSEFMELVDSDELNIISGLVEVLEKAQQRIAELEESEKQLCAANVTLDARAELAERRKAEQDSEPVFFIEVEGDDWINAGRIPGSTFDFNNLPDGINNLYAAPQPAPVVSFYRDGIEAAAKWIDQQREAYDSERGWFDPDTGSFEFGNDAQREYSSTLEELAEGIRALHPNAGMQPALVVPEEKPMPKASSMYAVDAVAAIAEVKGWNACRAAALAAAPQDEAKKDKPHNNFGTGARLTNHRFKV